LLKDDRGAQDDAERGAPFAQQVRNVVALLRGNSTVANTVVGFVLVHMAFVGIAFAQLWLTRERGLDAASMAQKIGLLGIAFGVLGSLVGGVLSDRLARRLPGGHAGFVVLLILICGPLMVAYRFADSGSTMFYVGMSAAFFLPHTRFWELAAGGWLALQQAGQRPAADGVPATGTGRWPQHAASVAGLSAIGLGAVLIDRHSAFPGAWALLPVGGALLLIQAGPAACINRHLLARAPMRWIGRISFSLYLWHWPLLVYGRIWLVGEPDWPQRLALVAVSVLLAWLSYRWIETPFRSAPTRRAPRPWSPGPVRFLAGMMAATFCAGVVLHLARGYPDRMPDKRDYIAFFDDYRYTRTHDLLRFDHHECNFYDIESGRAKTAIAATCLRPAAAHRRSVLLWGDSHAQHLAYGLDRTLPADVALLHVGASGCPPNVDDVHPDPLDSCNRANRLAWQAIGELHPDVVMLAQQGGHSITQYDALIARLHAGGVAQVVLIGPVPHWQPFLYQVVLKKYWQATPVQIGSNLDPAMFGLDAGLQRRYAGMPGVTYVSMIGPLCHDGACLAYLDGDRKEKLMTYDYAHFTLPASEFVVRTVVYPAMSGLLN
ncbi:MAG TPA: SGNH hydrolase domain-containing protein, partial [Plasticicumulans sp.]|nr:SGNH hydrolase domain-containing protein [Plasticicumulans sp.]